MLFSLGGKVPTNWLIWFVSPDIKEREGKKGENEEYYGGGLCKCYGEFFDKACVCKSTRLDDVFCILIQKYKLQRKLPRWNVEEISWRKYLEELAQQQENLQFEVLQICDDFWRLLCQILQSYMIKPLTMLLVMKHLYCSIPATKHCGAESSIIVRKVCQKLVDLKPQREDVVGFPLRTLLTPGWACSWRGGWKHRY